MLESILFWNIFNFLITILEYVPFKIILDKSCELKDNTYVSNKLILNLSLILIIIISTLLTIFNLNIYFKLFLNIIFMFSFCKVNYIIKTSKSIYLAVGYNLMLVCLEIVSEGLIMLVNSRSYLKEVLSQNYMEFEVAIISKFSLLLIIPIVKGISLKKRELKKEYVFLTFPVVIHLLILLIVFRIMSVMKLNKESIIILIALGILISTNIICLVFNMKILKINKINTVNGLIHERNKFIYKYYSELENYKLERKNFFDTKNKMLDLILFDKKQICDKEKIILCANIDFSPCDFISISDVCNIFSNLIDNSIEVCNLIKDDKFIKKTIKIEGKVCGASNRMYFFKICSTKLFELVQLNR